MRNKQFYSERNRLYRELPYAKLILNAGCGSGAFLRYYPYNNSFVVNLDNGTDDSVGWPAWGSARRGWKGWCEFSKDWSNVKNIVGDIKDLSIFPSSTFNLAVLGQVLEHVTPNDAHLVIEEFYRILDGGGYIQIDTPNPDSPVKDYVTTHTHEYNELELKELLYVHGFKLIDFRELAGYYCWWGLWRR